MTSYVINIDVIRLVIKIPPYAINFLLQGAKLLIDGKY